MRLADAEHARALKSGTTKNCTTLPVLVYVEDVVANRNVTAVGRGSSNVPFYDERDGSLLGYYTGALTVVRNDTIGTIAWSLGDTLGGPYASQFVTVLTNTGAYDSIVGGNGQYGCAEGYVVYVPDPPNGTFVADMHFCSGFCPYLS